MSAANPPAEVYTHQQIMQVVTGVGLCILLAALDQTMVIPAVPSMAAELHGFDHLSWIVTAYLLTSTTAAPVLGRLSDLWGRRPLIMGALGFFVAASVLCALARSVGELILFRGLQGLGGGGLISLAQTAVADVVSPRGRARYQPYLVSMWGIAATLGPALGGYVTQHLSWRYCFWLNVPFGALALVLCRRGLAFLPRGQGRGQVDLPGILVFTLAVTALLLLTSNTDLAGWLSPVSAALLGSAFCLLLLLRWIERRVADPLLPPRLFANRECIGAIMVASLASVHNMAGAFLPPLYFQLALGLSPAQSGALVMPGVLGFTVAAYVCGQVMRRVDRLKPMLLVGLGMNLTSFMAMSLLGPAQGLLPFLAAAVLLGLGLGLSFSTLILWVQNAAEPRDIGIALGTQLLLRSMSGAFGSAISGALLVGFFIHAMRGAGLGSARLEDLRQGSPVLARLAAGHHATMLAAVTSGFHAAFLGCCLLGVAAMLVTLRLKDPPLRTRAALHHDPG